MISVARKHENVVIDTSAYTIKRYPPEIVRYLNADGHSKVLFGSNHPMIAPAKALDGLDALGLSDETREAFLHGNTERVFGLSVEREGPGSAALPRVVAKALRQNRRRPNPPPARNERARLRLVSHPQDRATASASACASTG